jgi:hypothetical protein
MKEILEQLKDELYYNKDTGELIWIIPKKGRQINAGTINVYGYKTITYNNYKISCTKIIWYFMTGELPTQPIGFVDKDSTNLKWDNLKLTTRQELLATYRLNKDRIERKNNPNIGVPMVIKYVSFSNEEVTKAVEDFIKNKTLVNGRYIAT